MSQTVNQFKLNGPQLPYSLRLLKTSCHQLFYLRIEKKRLKMKVQCDVCNLCVYEFMELPVV